MKRELKPCGTLAAHRRHVRAGEEPCQPCREAYTAEQARLRHNRLKAHGNTIGRQVEFPHLGPDTFSRAPCVTDGPDLWETQRDHELSRDAQQRWAEASKRCLTQCPAYSQCARLADAQGVLDGVWAGRIPKVRGERR